LGTYKSILIKGGGRGRVKLPADTKYKRTRDLNNVLNGD